MSRNLKLNNDIDIDIELTDEENFDDKKVYENTRNLVKKINENKFDLNDRISNSKRKSPKKLSNRD